MPTLDELRECQRNAEPSVTLDEAAWQAWLTKGRLQDERSSLSRLKAVEFVSMIGLLSAAGLWSHVVPYEIVFRSAVAAVSIFVMLSALRSRHYIFAALFGALGLLYNPIRSVFAASGSSQRVLLSIAAIVFAASLGWRDERKSQ